MARTSKSNTVVDGVTILGDGTDSNPLHSGLSTYGVVAITGTVDGSNLNFTVPSGVTVMQLVNGTQNQVQGIHWNQSGTAVTFTAGNAPVVVDGNPALSLTAFGSTSAAIAASNTTQSQWVGWALSEAYRLSSIVRDANSVLLSANVTYPDGASGVFTTTAVNSTFKCVDGYTITNATLGKTLTQPTMTRDVNGQITIQPAIIIS